MKHILLFFSAGGDSTYLMYKNLKEGHIVTPVYVKNLRNKQKFDVEYLQIRKLLTLFSKKFPNQVYKLNERGTIYMRQSSHVTNASVLGWILMAANLQDPSLHTEVQIGLIDNYNVNSSQDFLDVYDLDEEFNWENIKPSRFPERF